MGMQVPGSSAPSGAYPVPAGEKGEKGGCGKKTEKGGEEGGGLSLDELLKQLPPEQRAEVEKLIAQGKDLI